jgi:hypothetical protein
LHGTTIRHQHLEITIRVPGENEKSASTDAEPSDPVTFLGTFLGALEVFGDTDGPDRTYHWAPRSTIPDPEDVDDPSEIESHKQRLALIKEFKRKGSLAAVYFPLKLFGASPRVGLSFQQRQHHQAITRELTRGRGHLRPHRPDKAEVIIAGQTPPGGSSTRNACPYLQKGQRYVGFNGNGKGRRQRLHACGYKLFAWMRKAAYQLANSAKERWRQVRLFLRNFTKPASLLGFTVAAWHPRDCTWLPLADLMPLTKTSAGRTWLRHCLIRVYTGEDYLIRWRQFFASRLGFSVIPAYDRDQAIAKQAPTDSPQAFLAYLNRQGVSASILAEQLGVSRTLVSLHLSGKRRWTPSWTKRIGDWNAGSR